MRKGLGELHHKKLWLLLVAVWSFCFCASGMGSLTASLNDSEVSINNTLNAGIWWEWLQTSQADFEAGVSYQMDTSSSPGDVKLPLSYDTVTDTFADETKIVSKTGVVVTGGQVELINYAGGAETLRPNATGSRTQIASQYLETGEHWDKVDGATSDESTYVYTYKRTYETDLYELTDHSLGIGAINGVTVYFRFSGGSDGGDPKTGYAMAVIKTDNGIYEGSEEGQAGITFITRSYSWNTNPQTGLAWTWQEIDNLQAGVKIKTADKNVAVRCTQVYVEVSYSGGYGTSGELVSTNLLSGQTVQSIDSFGCYAPAIPAGTSLGAQFSQDTINWYSSSGAGSGWDTLSEGTNTISLSSLGWSGANFNYKMLFISDGTLTPILDEVSVNYSSGYFSTGIIASQVHDTGLSKVNWDRLIWTETLLGGTDITFEARASNNLFAEDAQNPKWVDLGTVDSPISSELPSRRYIQWRATLKAASDNSQTPVLHEVTVFYS